MVAGQEDVENNGPNVGLPFLLRCLRPGAGDDVLTGGDHQGGVVMAW
jgi:hypothetical protein